MAKQVFSNNARATLQSAITAGSTSIVLATGKGALFASPTAGDWQLATLTDGTNYEIVKITARSTDTLTVTRAQESTSARAWSANALIYAGVTKETLENFAQDYELSAVSSSVSTLSSSVSALGIDTGGNARGVNAINLQPSRSNAANVASGSKAITIGYDSKATYDHCIAIGAESCAGRRATWTANTLVATNDVVYSTSGNHVLVCTSGGTTHATTEPTWVTTDAGNTTTDNTVTWMYLGDSASSDYATALGGGSNVSGSRPIAIGASAVSLDYGIALGSQAIAANQSIAIGTNTLGTYASIAIGNGATCSAASYNIYSAIAIGSNANAASTEYCMALGGDAVNRLPYSWVVSGANLLRKDNGENANWEHVNYAGTKTVYFSKEVDLKSLTDDIATITIPTNATFYPDEMGIVITLATSVTGNPDVSFGVTGNTTSLLASTTVTAVAAKNRTVFTPLSKHGVNSLTASVKTAATGTALKGRFYWVGMLVEDE